MSWETELSAVRGVIVDRSSPIPIYFQVATQLQKLIESDTIPVGTRFENEVDLAERVGVSRPTMRRAMQYLVERGMVVRKRAWEPRSCTRRSAARSNSQACMTTWPSRAESLDRSAQFHASRQHPWASPPNWASPRGMTSAMSSGSVPTASHWPS